MFIRPEVTELLRRNIDGIIGCLILLVGIKVLISFTWLGLVLGLVLSLIGFGLIVGAWQKLFLVSVFEGAGLLEVNERQVSYLHIVNGGVISLDFIDRISLITNANTFMVQKRFWCLEQAGIDSLIFPISVKGIETFIGSLAVFSNVDYGIINVALKDKSKKKYVVWQR